MDPNRPMQNALRTEIKKVSTRMLGKSASREKKEDDYRSRFTKRTGLVSGVSSKLKKTIVNKHFDPIYCKRNANFLAKTIWKKVLDGTYEPKPALNFFVDKPNGGKRSLMAFSLPDTALANIMMRRLRERNIKRFSPHSFAYHPDKNIFDAILELRTFIRTTPKVYSVQIDFKSYFDLIPSSYIESLLSDPEVFALTPVEKKVLLNFIYHKYAELEAYKLQNFKRRHRGTPQGSSISLVLANLASHTLDTALERLPGKFVRFADDVTALCENYEDALKIERQFFKHCDETGIQINNKKSKGIAILGNKLAEIRTTPHIDYLGYRFTEDGLILSDKTVDKIKIKISRIISLHLTHYIKKKHSGSLNNNRFSRSQKYDWDLLGLISEIRNYLYGGLHEKEIQTILCTGKKLRKMNGLMSFYALLDNKVALQELDGWLAGSIQRAMRKRNTILRLRYGKTGITPNSRSLIVGDWLDLQNWQGNSKPEVRLPSFVRGWRAARKYYLTFGIKDITPPRYGYEYNG